MKYILSFLANTKFNFQYNKLKEIPPRSAYALPQQVQPSASHL